MKEVNDYAISSEFSEFTLGNEVYNQLCATFPEEKNLESLATNFTQIFYRGTFGVEYVHSYMNDWRADEFHNGGNTNLSMSNQHVLVLDKGGSLFKLDFSSSFIKQI